MQPFFTLVAIQPDTWSYEILQGKKTHQVTERRQLGVLEPCHTPPYSGWRSQGWLEIPGLACGTGGGGESFVPFGSFPLFACW